MREYRRLKPELRSYFSSFGRPEFHPSLNWKAWADGGFAGMPQAYENLNAELLQPAQCVARRNGPQANSRSSAVGEPQLHVVSPEGAFIATARRPA